MVPDTGISHSPGAVVFNNQLYCYHQGSGNCGELWFNQFNLTAWRGDQRVENTGMSAGPAAAEFQGQIFCLHQGTEHDGQMWANFDPAFDLMNVVTGLASKMST